MIYGNREFVDCFQRSEHFVWRNGHWQAVLIQFTAIPENHRASVHEVSNPENRDDNVWHSRD